MPERCLALYLDGPMQSWGHASRFNRRTTLAFPTRSGVTGMLCAALGVDRSDRGMPAALASLEIEVLSLRHPTRWTDYHTVGGGYDPKTQRQWMPRKANASTPDPVLTDREYLADAKFGVLLSGKPPLLGLCHDKLQNPVWGLWLGRKCCIPASPVCQGLFASRGEAVEHLKSLASARVVRRVREVRRFDDGNDTLMDVPVCFETREFRPRRIENEPDPGDDDARL